MKLILQKHKDEDNQLVYMINDLSIPSEIINQELTYQDYINLSNKDAFLKSFFNSEFCNPYWYKDSNGKLVYRRVVNNNRGN